MTCAWSAPPRSLARRFARSSAEAVRNTFTAASGATTEPMSRPSATQSPVFRMARCLAISASRTPGSAATRDAPADTSGVRIAVVTSRPSSRTRSPTSMSILSRDLGGVAALLLRRQRDSPVHRARVQVREAEPVCDGPGHGGLAGPGGAVDRDHHGE